MPKKDFNQTSNSKPPPFSIRFSWEQRSELDRLTQGQSWGGYIKEMLFVIKKRIPRQYSKTDKILLAKILGTLGQSRMASNLNQLARAANSGSLPVNEEVVKALMEACRNIQWIRATLIEAMGIKSHQSKKPENQSSDP